MDIRLRALEPEDWKILYEWENDRRNWQLSQTTAPYSKHILQKFIETSNNDLFVDRQLRLMVEDTETCETVGVLDFFEMDPVNSRVGIGILIGEEFRRRGYGLTTLQLAKQYAFEIVKVHQVFCHIIVSNDVSFRLFKKAGFSVVGVQKDWLATASGFENVYLLQCLRS